MKASLLATSALAVLAAGLPVSGPVEAGTGIQRCQAADGTTVYTDLACSSLSARNAPISGELMTRIAREEAEYGAGPTLDDSQASNAIPTSSGRRSPADGCARTPTQLAMDLQASFALGDVNRLAESWNWVGRSSESAKPLMQRLERMSRENLRNVQYFDAHIGSGLQVADASFGGPQGAGIMQVTVGKSSPQVMDLQVQRYAGCYFVSF